MERHALRTADRAASRATLRATVAARRAGDRREAWAQRGILSAIDAGTEDGPLIHVTAAAVVVSTRGVLLHVHKRLGRWTLPGGHVEPGEPPAVTAGRETREETGVPAIHPEGAPVVVHLDVYRSARGHTHLEVRYLLEAPPLDPDPLPGESPQVAWFPWDGTPSGVEEGVAAALRSARDAVAWKPIRGGSLLPSERDAVATELVRPPRPGRPAPRSGAL